jgi:hypothetical protein
MNTYTSAQLSLAATYERDRALATLARKVAAETFDSQGKGAMGLGEWKRLLLAGGRPDLIAAELRARSEAEEREKARAIALQALHLPSGYSLQFEGSLVFLQGPFQEAWNVQLKPLGGHWHGARKAWGIPMSRGEDLAALVKTWRS